MWNEVTNKCPWDVFFGTPPIQHYHQLELPLWSLNGDAQAELVSAAPALSQWQDIVEKLASWASNTSSSETSEMSEAAKLLS
jgi:hypothetical protein